MYDCEGEGRNIAGEITVYWSGLERDSDSPWSANQTRFRGQSSFFFWSSWISGFFPLANQLARERNKRQMFLKVASVVSGSHGSAWTILKVVAKCQCENVALGKTRTRTKCQSGKKTEVLTWRPLRGWCHPNFDKSSIAAEGIKWTCQKEIKKKRDRGKKNKTRCHGWATLSQVLGERNITSYNNNVTVRWCWRRKKIPIRGARPSSETPFRNVSRRWAY